MGVEDGRIAAVVRGKMVKHWVWQWSSLSGGPSTVVMVEEGEKLTHRQPLDNKFGTYAEDAHEGGLYGVDHYFKAIVAQTERFDVQEEGSTIVREPFVQRTGDSFFVFDGMPTENV